MAIPTSSASGAKLTELNAWLRDYASTRVSSALMDERRCVQPHIVLDFGNRGIFGIGTEERFGGLGLDFGHQMRFYEQLAAIDLTLATWVSIHNALGVRPIERFATGEVKSELVPLLASGRTLGALAMTERSAGSNPRAIQTLARSEGDGFRIKGSKIWIGNGSWAGVINVFARRTPEEGSGMNAFCLRAGTPGLRIGPEALTFGMRAIVQNEVFLDDVYASAGQLLGTPGDGFAVAEDAFSLTRLAIAANSIGGLRRCTQIAMRYVSQRQIATGLSLKNPTTREALTWLVCAAASLEELVSITAAHADRRGEIPVFLSALCKVLGSELLSKGADLAVQLLGGRGYIEPNVLPQIVRDSRIYRIFEGPSETIEAYLGSAVVQGTLGLDAFFGHELPAPRVLEVMRDALVQCKEAQPAPQARQHVRGVAGRLFTWATLAAAAEHADARLASRTSAMARRWAMTEFQRQVRDGVAQLREPTMLEAADLEEEIATYDSWIGDIVQDAAGADFTIDPMLLPRGRAAGATANSASAPPRIIG